MYKTVKQEEIYCYPTYPSKDIARKSLACYIEEYNDIHPALSIGLKPSYWNIIGERFNLTKSKD